MIRLLKVHMCALTLGLGLSASASAAEMRAFHTGEVWTVKASPPSPMRVVIGKVESFHGHDVCHVAVTDVPVPSDIPLPESSTTFGHMPFDCSALGTSVDKLEQTGVTPPKSFANGYAAWSEAPEGLFTIPVSQAIDMMFSAIRSQQKSAPAP